MRDFEEELDIIQLQMKQGDDTIKYLQPSADLKKDTKEVPMRPEFTEEEVLGIISGTAIPQQYQCWVNLHSTALIFNDTYKTLYSP